MTEYIPTEKGVPIRQPSTANLMLDSADRNTNVYPTAFDFQIVKSANLQNGFFTRVGTTEVVLEWCEPNVPFAPATDRAIWVDVSGVGANTSTSVGGFTLVDSGFYNVSELLSTTLNAIKTRASSDAQIYQDAGGKTFISSGNTVFRFTSTNGTNALVKKLGLSTGATYYGRENVENCPDLRLYRYIDICAPNLTYAQDVKDASTAPKVRDVLNRWYFAEDVPVANDNLGFPILQGYEPFVRRRVYNPPKQIKWQSNLPVGNLDFQIYDNNGNLVQGTSDTNWLMTLQLSEV